jgi:predicted RNase H-like HicB family nuclease
MRAEYDFAGGVRGKYVDRYRQGTNVIVLDPELAETSPESRSGGGLQRNNVEERSMETASIPITVGREEDGRWWADVESMPGVMAYGATRESAIGAARALALRVAAGCIERGEDIPEPFTKLFSVA